jgi:PPIC-type PPIASE domain
MKKVLLILAACGGGGKQAPPTPVGPAAQLVAPAAGSDDLVVATVNGRPVWASCVRVQRSLDDCVGFELMAQEAEKRGLSKDYDVRLATRTALVSRFVQDAYETKMDKPSDFGDAWAKQVAPQIYKIDHDEVRASHYVRVQDQALGEQIAAEAAKQTGWMPQMLDALAERLAAGRRVDKQDVPYKLPAQLEDHYAGALFAIPEVGRTSPVTKTPWGWDIILYSDVLPARHPSQEEIVKELLPPLKERYFSVWVHQIEVALNIKVEENPKRLEELPE